MCAMAEFNSGNQYCRGRQTNKRAGQERWTARRTSGDSNWNSRPPFSHSQPPSFCVPPPPLCGSPPWMTGPPPQFCVPPPSFSGPPPFSSPPPQFSGPPPFGSQSTQNTPSPCWNSQHTSSPSTGPWSGSGAGQSGDKRRMNNVWSDSSLFSNDRRTFEGQQNRNGYSQSSHHSRGQQSGRGAGRRGRGRGHQQFQQERNSKNKGNCFQNNNSSSSNSNNCNINNNNNQSSGGTKKEKVDKRDLPENNKYHCEVCDRGFRTEEKYQEHVDEHTQCWVDGCRYIAAPKLVQLHYYAQHKTGVAKKIWSLDNPESIQKWIEERKRNYPTKENVARKEKERAERRARGQVIDNKQFGKMRGRGRGRGRGRRDYHHGGGGGGFEGGWKESSDVCQRGGLEENHGTHTEDGQQTSHWLPGTQSVKGKEDIPQENATLEPTAKRPKLDEDEGERECTQEKECDSKDPLSLLINGDGSSEDSNDTSPVQAWGDGLTSLIASYDESSKEGSELREDAHTATDDTQREEDRKWEGTPDDIAPVIRTCREEPSWIRLNRRRKDQKSRNTTLLERLLVNEIRHERNVLLQCVHYIVKNNFLGVVGPTTDTAGH